MDFSIIIVNYRTKGLVRESIKSFKRLTHGVRVEYIVVDSGRDPGLKGLLAARFPDVTYLGLRRNLGFSGGVNTGIGVARGKYIFVLNADIIALDGLLDRLYAHMESHPDVGISGPQLLNPDRTIQQSYYRFHTPLTPVFRRFSFGGWRYARTHLDRFLMKDLDPSRTSDVDWLLGAALCVRRSAIEKVGYMDATRFFLYFEDTDWCKRFWRAGYRVQYVPHAQMIHLYKRDSAQKRGWLALRDPAARTHVVSGVRYFLKYWREYAQNPFHLP